MVVTRVLTLDCGIQYTGIALADIDTDFFEFITIECFIADDTNTLVKFLKDKILPLMISSRKTLVLYESIFSSKLYPNWKLIKIQRDMRNMCEKVFNGRANFTIKTLMPSQKIGLDNNKKRGNLRKQFMVANTADWINTFHPEFFHKFNSYKRNHDIADAIGMLRYIQKQSME